MGKNEICIVIPIFKENLNDFEIQSVAQCVNLLSDYQICFICPAELNICFYKSKFPSINNYIFFDKYHFVNFKSYNKLMLNPNFYSKFKNYKFMLIYQTDCYVFKDDLLAWCKKDYDYIGGIWFKDFTGNPNEGAKLWQAGNGGFSLRKITSMIRILSSKKPSKNIKQLIIEKNKLFSTDKINYFKEFILLPLNILGYENNYSFKAKNYNLNEDFYFVEASLKLKDFNIPKVENALSFSWDRNPQFLYEKLGSLPFGCHAWYREDYPYEGNRDFWMNKILK